MIGITRNKKKKKMQPSIVKNIENIYSYTSTLHAVDMSLRSKYLYLRTAGERRIEICLGIMFNVDNGRPSLALPYCIGTVFETSSKKLFQEYKYIRGETR